MGYNQFAYCFNNPVNLSDYSGAWPQWIETATARIKHSVTFMIRLIASPFKAAVLEVGGGIGLGAGASATVGGVTASGELSATITDYAVFDNGEFDTGTKASCGGSLGIQEIFEYSYQIGTAHSFSACDCTCNPWTDPYGDRLTCSANRPIQEHSYTLGISA